MSVILIIEITTFIGPYMLTAPENRFHQQGRRFFIYAPPIKGRRRRDTGELVSKRRLPNPPFKAAETWQCSVYYFWWEFLRRHSGYKKTCQSDGKGKYSKLYRDFGNVHASDVFWDWWTHHQSLFSEPKGRVIKECRFNTHFEHDDDTLVLSVPLEIRTAYLVKLFRKALDEHEDRIAKARRKSRALYPVASKPNLQALYTAMVAWDTKQAHPNAKLHELYDLVEPHTNMAIDQRVEVAGDDADDSYLINLPKAEREARKSGSEDVFLREARAVVRRRKRQTLLRHLKAADALIENVGRGIFPLKQKRKPT